jgi:hypothetical protein
MTPEIAELRAQADAAMAGYAQALAAVVQLPLEAGRLRAKATALQAVEDARPAVQAAEDEVAAAEQAYGETAAPEEEAAARCARARHDAEAAADALEQGRAAREEPARIRDLLHTAGEAAQVAEWEAEALAHAQDARLQTRRDLDAARARLAGAAEQLAAKEAAVGVPFTSADRDLPERIASLIPTWHGRVAERHKPGKKMDEPDLAIARSLCAAAAEDLRVCPESIAIDIAAQTAWMVATKPRGTKVVIPYVGETTTMELLAAADKAHRAVR